MCNILTKRPRCVLIDDEPLSKRARQSQGDDLDDLCDLIAEEEPNSDVGSVGTPEYKEEICDNLPEPPSVGYKEPDDVDFSSWEERIVALDLDGVCEEIVIMFESLGGARRFESADPHEQKKELYEDLYEKHFPLTDSGKLNTPLDTIHMQEIILRLRYLTLYVQYFRKSGKKIDASTEESHMLNTIIRRISYIKNIRQNTTMYINGFNENYHDSWSDDAAIQLVLPNTQQNTTWKFIFHVVNEAHMRGYRHIGRTIVKAITINDRKIRAYEPVMTIEQFVYQISQSMFSEANNLLSGLTSTKKAFDMLENINYDMFPTHYPDVEWMGVRDGMLWLWVDGKEKFYRHGSPDLPKRDRKCNKCKSLDVSLDKKIGRLVCENCNSLDIVDRPDGPFASIYHNVNLEYDKFDEHQGSWEDPRWFNIGGPLHVSLKHQYSAGTW